MKIKITTKRIIMLFLFTYSLFASYMWFEHWNWREKTYPSEMDGYKHELEELYEEKKEYRVENTSLKLKKVRNESYKNYLLTTKESYK